MRCGLADERPRHQWRAPTARVGARRTRRTGSDRGDGIGVSRGDPVALILRNNLAFIEASLAVGRVGAYCVPTNWHNTVEETRYVLEDNRARVLIVHADLWVRLQEAIPAGASVIVVATPPEVLAA